jgi:AraC-like DNA-binding protein
MWGDMVWRFIGGLRTEAHGDTDFDARIAWGSASYLNFCKINASRHTVIRTQQHVRRSERGFLKVVAQLSGRARFEQFGRSVWLHPGEWSVYDTTHGYNVENAGVVEQLILMIPKERVPDRIALDQLMVRRMGSRLGVARLAWNTMLTAFQELDSMSDTAATGTADVVTQLVLLNLLELRGTSSVLSMREALRDRIKAYVDRHVHDSQLSVDAVATALNCSRRHLYNAFSDEPEGIAGYVLARRLEAARLCIEDAGQTGLSITAIALHVGFKSTAHFSRAFSTRFGCSPRLWRKRLPGRH